MHYEMSRFTWRIENFSKLAVRKLYSVAFVIDRYKWRLCLDPKDSTNLMYIYLQVADSSSLPNGWSIRAMYDIALINQIDINKTIYEGSGDEFDTKHNSWGFSLISLSKIHNKSEGFLVDDTCLLEAEVSVVIDFILPCNDNASDSSASLDDLIETVHVEIQSFLESVSKKPSSSCSVSKAPTCEMAWLKGHASSVQEILHMLNLYPFYALADPRNETAILESLSELNDHLYLFSDERAKEIINLKATFPQIMQEWRDSVQVKERSEHPWSSYEKTRNLLEDLVKTGEEIKAKLGELKKKEMGLKNKLEVIKSNIQQLMEEREELSYLTKAVCALAEQQASNIEGAEVELLGLANKKMKLDCKSKWAATRLLFG
ncbi:unnamed protein product [Cuscuta epithymum]|uniref:MATH domain-containing protein n=1 Tax=Cuscuta epithymum TaxID=186058 RepID=A0AAV0DER4_9ASTE|nr:unnamed protein product [Cuscuta epithymum]